jgi:hypothetical protein
MDNHLTSISTSRFFRSAMLLFALVLGCQAIWILGAEYFRSPDLRFPGDAKTAANVADSRKTTAEAASFGFVRGDLWAEYALTYLNLFWRDSEPAQSELAEGRRAALRALAFAPHDSRVWLALASIYSRSKEPGKNTAGVLQMSYFTGTNETDLIPFRLFLATHSDAIAEKDLQQLVRHDVLSIVTRKPELKGAILAAYQSALPVGREFLDQTLKDLDPQLLDTLGQNKK